MALSDERLAQPGETSIASCDIFAGLQETLHGQQRSRPGRVICSGSPCFAHAHDPLCQVAHIDKLYGRFWIAWDAYFASLRDPVQPVGEAIGRVVRANDVAGANL